MRAADQTFMETKYEETEHLEWQFESPDLAKGEVFETGVNLIPKDTEQAKCMNEDCPIRSQNR